MRIGLILLLTALLAGCQDRDMCENHVVQRLPSPDGALEAIVFQRDCGEGEALATHIDIATPGMEPRGAGTVFIASHGTPHQEWGGAQAMAQWNGPLALEVLYDGASEVFREQQYIDGVAVTYRQAN